MVRSIALASALLLSTAAPIALAQSGSGTPGAPPSTTQQQKTPTTPTTPGGMPGSPGAPTTTGPTGSPGETTSPRPADPTAPRTPGAAAPPTTPGSNMGGPAPADPMRAPDDGGSPTRQSEAAPSEGRSQMAMNGSCYTRRAEGDRCSCLKAPTTFGVSQASASGRNMCVMS